MLERTHCVCRSVTTQTSPQEEERAGHRCLRTPWVTTTLSIQSVHATGIIIAIQLRNTVATIQVSQAPTRPPPLTLSQPLGLPPLSPLSRARKPSPPPPHSLAGPCRQHLTRIHPLALTCLASSVRAGGHRFSSSTRRPRR